MDKIAIVSEDRLDSGKEQFRLSSDYVQIVRIV